MTFARKLFKKLIHNPNKIWIMDDNKNISYGQVLADIDLLKEKFSKNTLNLKHKVIGIAMKTSYDFIIADLICLKEQAITLPIPLEFDNTQIKSLLNNVQIILVRNDSDMNRLTSILPKKPIMNVMSGKMHKGNNTHTMECPNLLHNITKIIHTSGTTSNPKGVLIKDESLNILVHNLLNVFPKNPLTYLSLVPLSLLVEQIFGIYCTLLSDGKLILPPESLADFGGYESDSEAYLDLIRKYQPNFMYLAPRLLEDLNKLASIEGFKKDAYYITGGAKINHETLKKLDHKGIKIYEGYGLSETTSVVSINGPDDRRIGTAGKILPHLNYKINEGELLLKGSTICAGYFTKDESSCDIDEEGYLHTGDLVEIDEDRYLTIKGRKKNLLILSNARNISPEWVESKLKHHNVIEDCIILGDGKDFLTALILGAKPSKITSIIHKVNSELPNFAQIQNSINIPDIEKFKRKYFTVTGRPRRSLIHKEYINDL
ncbi:MAG: hypothetical protein B7Y25_03080 [Alphaproteobacteria bacterium 16-39-46]|nr:MAG: hypothetical protein B7Y25_03080 [Alphaproteobacteria bacterium 16-39-46]OZA43397.1 MAG: hypothetical protein B7X84_03280 [Alphaproteobacteria bacterium 17-39-52]HQS83886.1 AMP-binding protein [Alphaproteobacteria bacterium]HQS93725.1 AMP-binding protein [Alphaproteobacteria bacterium]